MIRRKRSSSAAATSRPSTKRHADAGPFLGEYQGFIVGKGIRLALGAPDATDEIQGAIHHSGLFFTAWGSMVLDFGPWGALLALFTLGVLGGGLYIAGVQNGSLPGRLLLAYFYMFVIASPIHSPLPMGNATQVLVCLLAACVVLRTRRPQPRLQASPEPKGFPS